MIDPEAVSELTGVLIGKDNRIKELEAELTQVKSERDEMVKRISWATDEKVQELEAEVARVKNANDSLYAYKTVRGSHLEIENEELKIENLRLSEQLGKCIQALTQLDEAFAPLGGSQIARDCLTSLSKGKPMTHEDTACDNASEGEVATS